MKIASVNERHSGRRAFQRLSCIEAAEASAENNNAMLALHGISLYVNPDLYKHLRLFIELLTGR